jgi:hypothetical protein
MFRKTASFILFLILFIGAFFGYAKFAYGQTYQTFQSELNQILEQARWLLGPFRVYPRINLRLLGYDRNVFFQREEDGPAADLTTTISPELQIYLLLGDKLIFSVSEQPSYVFYFKYKNERRLNNSFSPAVKWLLFNRFVLQAHYTYQTLRSRPTSEFNVRTNFARERIHGALFYETARESSFGITASIETLTYDDILFPGQEVALSGILNRKEKKLGGEFYYRIFSQSFFFVNVEYTKYEFNDSLSKDKDSYSIQTDAGIQFPLAGDITGTLALGYKKIVPVGKGIQEISGLIGNTEIHFRRGRFGAHFSYRRDFPFSFYSNNAFFIDSRFVVRVDFYPFEFLRIDYSYSYGKSQYPELFPVRNPDGSWSDIRRTDLYYIHSLGLVVRLIRATGIGIRFNDWSRVSNYSGASRNRDFIELFIETSF